MAMVGRHDSLFDASCGKLTDRSRQVIYDRVHHLPGLEREARLACVVDLLRAHHDDLSAFDLLGEPRWLQAQKLVERDISQVRHARGGELLTSREVGKKRVVDAHTECAALLDDAEARGRPWLKRCHSNRRDAWQRTDGGPDNDFGGLWEPLSELNTHLEAHGIDKKVRDRLRPLSDDLAVDVRLVQGSPTRSSWRAPWPS